MDREQAIKNLQLARQPRPKKVKKPIAKKSAKKIKQEAEEKKLRNGDDTLMEQFYKARRKEMTGKCFFCGGKTEKDNDQTFRASVAHLFAKRDTMFPSIMYHKDNWLELCFYGNSCHRNFDDGIISLELLKDSKEWDIIVEKFHVLAPLLTDEERANKFYQRLEKLIYGSK